MNAVEAIRYYVQKMVAEPGMKVMLMDTATVRARVGRVCLKLGLFGSVVSLFDDVLIEFHIVKRTFDMKACSDEGKIELGV